MIGDAVLSYRIIFHKNPAAGKMSLRSFDAHGIFSAPGMVMGYVIKECSLTVMLRKAGDRETLAWHFAELEHIAMEEFRGEGMPDDRIILEHCLDMRYRGQPFETMVPFERVIQSGSRPPGGGGFGNT